MKDFLYLSSFGTIPLASENVVPSPKAAVALASCLFIGVQRQGATLPNDSLSSVNVTPVSQDHNITSSCTCACLCECESVPVCELTITFIIHGQCLKITDSEGDACWGFT